MWWTTEQVAEHAGMTVEQVWETRRRKEWPGVLGIRQGRRLRFDPEMIKAGPREPERTDDAATAAVWLLEDIRNLVGQIHQAIIEIRAWQREQRVRPWETMVFTTDVDSDGTAWTLDEEREEE